MVNESRIIKFGKYKGWELDKLPTHYLIQLYKDDEIMAKYPEIKDYIELAHASSLPLFPSKRKMLEAFKNKKYEPLPCDKTSYVDQDAALKALKLIKQDKRDHKKPHRAYQCEICQYWHLTSKPKTPHTNDQ